MHLDPLEVEHPGEAHGGSFAVRWLKGFEPRMKYTPEVKHGSPEN